MLSIEEEKLINNQILSIIEDLKKDLNAAEKRKDFSFATEVLKELHRCYVFMSNLSINAENIEYEEDIDTLFNEIDTSYYDQDLNDLYGNLKREELKIMSR